VASLKELKGRINSVKSTQKITKAKQMVAAAKLRRAQANAEAARPYASRMHEIVAGLAARLISDGNSPGSNAPRLFTGTGRDAVHLLIVTTSDRGLCGAFNANIVKAARARAQALEAAGKTVVFYIVGRKGRAAIRREWPHAVIGQFDTSEMREPSFAVAEAITNALLALFDAGKFDVAHLFFSRFKSALVQEPTEAQLIPVPPPATVANAAGGAIEYEPDEPTILGALLPAYLKTQIFAALLENAAGEQGASMTAMDNATRNAGELINKLTIQYNRSRQAAITTELIEIIAGAEAL